MQLHAPQLCVPGLQLSSFCACCGGFIGFGCHCHVLAVPCSQVQLFFQKPEQWAQVLGAAIPQTSNFFLNYVIMRAFMLNPVRLLMPREFTCD